MQIEYSVLVCGSPILYLTNFSISGHRDFFQFFPVKTNMVMNITCKHHTVLPSLGSLMEVTSLRIKQV